MEFKKYSSIENSYRDKFVNRITEEGHAKQTFVVQEKIHGSNFSLWASVEGIRAAKRTGFIKDDEKFFCYDTIIKKYGQSVLNILAVTGADEVAVFGELYGGIYPHKDVPNVDQSKVQSGVFYAPGQEFVAFDIKVDGKYLSVEHVNALCEEAGIPYSETLLTGSLEECLAYSNEFQTTIPAKLGLPEIEGNMCEGVVIRPIVPLFLFSQERLILKNKNAKFKEKTGDGGTRKTKAPPEPLSEAATIALMKANLFITKNRLRNVLSKIGEVTQKDFGKIMGLFSKDIIEDFLKEEQEFFDTLEKTDRKKVTKYVGQSAALMVRENFLNIVDGEF